MEVKKSWHRVTLQNKELLSKWLAKIRRTNTPVNEYSRICGDHFEPECFTKKPGSSRVNLKPGSIPTKFCFVQEKEARKPPKDRKPVEKQQNISDKVTKAADAQFAEDGNKNNDIELDIEES